jgi:hypothetical protein
MLGLDLSLMDNSCKHINAIRKSRDSLVHLNDCYMRFEMFTIVNISITIFWNGMQYSLLPVYQTTRLYIQEYCYIK